MVNTDWGDYFQVITDVNPGKFAKEKSWEQTLNEARRLAPPDQLQGNAIGQALSRYYQDPAHANKRLSEAYADIFATSKR